MTDSFQRAGMETRTIEVKARSVGVERLSDGCFSSSANQK